MMKVFSFVAMAWLLFCVLAEPAITVAGESSLLRKRNKRNKKNHKRNKHHKSDEASYLVSFANVHHKDNDLSHIVYVAPSIERAMNRAEPPLANEKGHEIESVEWREYPMENSDDDDATNDFTSKVSWWRNFNYKDHFRVWDSNDYGCFPCFNDDDILSNKKEHEEQLTTLGLNAPKNKDSLESMICEELRGTGHYALVKVKDCRIEPFKLEENGTISEEDEGSLDTSETALEVSA